MPFPQEIKVGPYAYKVVRGTRQQMGANLGLCDNEKLTIYVRKYLRKGKVQEILVHESIHAITYLAGRSEADRLTGEQWVEATTHGLLQVIRENPILLTYLSE